MGKRKIKTQDIERRKKLKQDQDAQLSTGLFNEEIQSDIEDGEAEENSKDWENEEQEYELRPRQMKEKHMVESLPIKKSDGTVERVLREVVQKEEPEEEDEEEQIEQEPPQEQEEEEEEEDSNLTPQEKLIKTKEEIAELASKLIENPEENISCLTRLRKMSESKNFMTSQLSIMSLIPIFKSLAPSYKIRPLTDMEKREKVSKEISRLRTFEQSLVINYKSYIELLYKHSKISYSNSLNNNKITSDQLKRGNLALKAANELCLSSLRHFNYRSELFTILIKRLNKKPKQENDLPIFIKSIRTLETLLKEDEEHGDITFDIIKIMTKTIKDKKFRIDESVLNIFLSISLLEDYDPNENKEDIKPKLKKKNRIHLSKKERKNRKERKEIEDEMRSAQQAITIEQREKYQSQVLKMILMSYLEILKAGQGSFQKGDENDDAVLLVGSVLEGLSKYGQMANFDLLGDFLQVLREIMVDIMEEQDGIYTGKEIKIILLCIATSFSLVLNHGSMGRLPIAIDFNSFIDTLYKLLTYIALDPDLEFSHKTLRLADPITEELNKPSVNVSTKSELLLRCLDFIFFRSKNGTISRASAFTKRLYILALQTPEKTSLAILKFIGKLMSRYDNNLKGLWNTEDSVGEGNYILGIEKNDESIIRLERCNIGSATLWENVLLDNYYAPMVKDGSRSLMKNSKSEGR
ncbi:uncharacterized protein KGF55_005148 [Candida pseudojiufengensis]|uniref:uncharacterized protein n=1 Tax=Candida pseudojiufengensis TaxID=497109 RepID=UPI0022256F08|nr:uncharacterized protein KGF55_005148 [Candida pseudojiufengensis]KAI5959916.1 hypothetical protein KGF55_005148 [Candida pseudojiufengensis]